MGFLDPRHTVGAHGCLADLSLMALGGSLFFKINPSLLAVVPLLRPLAVLWIGNFPTVLPSALQCWRRLSADVMDCWRHVIGEGKSFKRKCLWREAMCRGNDDMPKFWPWFYR